LLIESLELSDGDVIAAIVAQKNNGRDVRVLLADPTWDGSGNNAVTARTLDAAGIATRTIPKERMLVHVKSILVDGRRAYMGSENLTTGSLTKNREVGLVVTDAPALATMTSTFEADFASATNL
jgi:phosphatidylserine/phosphatidylglycerophosphate/cardiolipin synthase-like enzyme